MEICPPGKPAFWARGSQLRLGAWQGEVVLEGRSDDLCLNLQSSFVNPSGTGGNSGLNKEARQILEISSSLGICCCCLGFK